LTNASVFNKILKTDVNISKKGIVYEK